MAAESISPFLFAQLKASKRLPSPPGTALRVLELCRAEDADLTKIADTIKSDPALSARLLKFANSPLSGLNHAVASVREAMLLLGLRTVKLTALGFSVATTEATCGCPGFSIRQFWAESFLRAVIAKRLAMQSRRVDREEAFTAGLLAAIGRLALARGLAEQYAPVLEAARQGQPLLLAERGILQTDHIQFGAQLLRDWQLPEILSQAVATQGIDLTSMALNQPEHHLGWILQIANTLVTPLIPLSETGDEPPAGVRAVLTSAFGMDDQRANRMIDEILADYHEVASIFDVKLESQAEAVELYAEAQEEATRVGMVAQLEQAKMLAANRDLLKRATTDPLTGVANRAKFDERLGEELARVRRGQSDLCLIMLDIDHFKKFNDTHGHQVGDLVLKRVATAVRNILREVDLAARYGGEEFVVLAPQTDRKGACVLAARVQRCVQELRIDLCGMRLGVTISSGVAITADYAQAPTAEQFIGDADAQLYLSKEAGRNTWSYRGCSACRLKNAASLAV